MIAIPPALAENARTAQAPGRCPLCKPGKIHVGQRIACLPTGDWAHTWCLASVDPGHLPQLRARGR
jgi:hypothetical protein